MKNIYFISDAHLAFIENGLEVEKRKKLEEFLEYIRINNDKTGTLYLLGDIFDFWFEWYHVIPRYWFPILFQLRQLVNSGIEVNFITGNHDFYTGEYLEKGIGIKCYNECCEFQVDSKRFFVAHGDGFSKMDRGYRLLKKIIRNRFSIFLYKTFLSADLGVQMAKWFSNSSRQLVKIDKEKWAEEYYKYAQKKFKEGFDYVLLGHIHYPAIKKDNGKTYVNCGDWITQFTYAKYDGNSLTLNQWKGSKLISI